MRLAPEVLPPNPSGPLKIAVEAAAAAGDIICEEYRRSQTITEKGVGDLVSNVDAKSQQAIISHIRRKDPAGDILAEEGSGRHRMEGANGWIVDPLDATSDFLYKAGADYPAVLIAYWRDRHVRDAVMYFPLKDEWFTASRGGGAFYNGEPVRVPHGDTALQEAWVDINQYGDARLETPRIRFLRERLRKPGGARLVTSLVPHSGIVAKIIRGEPRISAVIHDNNPRKIKQAAWDVAAPQLILLEAGGCSVAFDGQRYNLFMPEPFIMAASAKMAADIIELAKR